MEGHRLKDGVRKAIICKERTNERNKEIGGLKEPKREQVIHYYSIQWCFSRNTEETSL